MTHISILSVFPSLYDEFLKTSLVKRAQIEQKISFNVAGFSSFCALKERIDGPTVGHGQGMAIRPEVVERSVDALEATHGKAFKVFVTPQGKKLTQPVARSIASHIKNSEHVMFVAGRYEGIDERVHEEYADLEISIGDYVLMGGDLPVMVILEASLRYVEGVVGRNASVEDDSFSGAFVDYPTFTVPPRVWRERAIPEVLLSGNHAAMDAWRTTVAVRNSVIHHFDWVRSHVQSSQERKYVAQALPHHYVALLHDDVLVQNGVVGTSSVTSMDIHDIARSSKTYGIKEYFLVTSLKDQQKIVETLLYFWHTAGVEYNENRSEAVGIVALKESLAAVLEAIEKKEGVKPLVIGTAARSIEEIELISYHDQEMVWKQSRPVLFIFGTAKGLSEAVLKKCDYLLMPVEGFTQFNHLSVRSAVAIILDRWMGLNRAKAS